MRIEEWRAAEQAFTEAAARFETLRDDLAALEVTHATLERLQRAAPILGELERLRVQLAELDQARQLPTDFGARWQIAVERQRSAVDAAARANSLVNRRKGERNDLPKDAGPLPIHADGIEALYRQVGNIQSLREGESKRDRDERLSNERLEGYVANLGAGPEDLNRFIASIR